MSNIQNGFKINGSNFATTSRVLEKSGHWKQDPITKLYTDTNPYYVKENKGWTILPQMYSTMAEANKAEQELIDTFTKLGLTKVTHAKVA